MKISIVANRPEYCSLYTHPFAEKMGEEVFCRVAKSRLKKDLLFCKDCPLMIYDADHEHCFGCLYYDTEGSECESDEKRIQLGIATKLLPEFPYYAEDAEQEKIEHALQFAAEAHKGAVRKGTKVAYIVHPTEVVGIVSTLTKDVITLQAAALHDVVEDTEVTMEDLMIEFGQEVAERVADMTEKKRRDLPAEDTWEIRKQESIEHYRSVPLESKKIALGDKLSNIRATVYDYKLNGDAIWERFNQKDKSRHAWYYRSLLDCLKELENTAAYQEYRSLVDEIFGL